MSFEFFRLDVNTNLSNLSKEKVMNSLTLHYLPIVFGQMYSPHQLLVASFDTTGNY